MLLIIIEQKIRVKHFVLEVVYLKMHLEKSKEHHRILMH